MFGQILDQLLFPVTLEVFNLLVSGLLVRDFFAFGTKFFGAPSLEDLGDNFCNTTSK